MKPGKVKRLIEKAKADKKVAVSKIEYFMKNENFKQVGIWEENIRKLDTLIKTLSHETNLIPIHEKEVQRN